VLNEREATAARQRSQIDGLRVALRGETDLECVGLEKKETA
jgi:hypothetical protein